jgi:hypothetical protein
MVTTVDEQQWRGTVNQILYLTNYARELSDEDVEKFVGRMIEYDFFPSGPAAYREALAYVLASGEILTPTAVPTRHEEGPIRDFLTRVAAELDKRRPWPEPAMRKLDVTEWPAFAAAKTVAHIDAVPSTVGERLRNQFDEVPVGELKLPVLIVQLRTGEKVALMGSTDPKSRGVTLLALDGDPEDVIAHFSEFTGYPAEEVKALGA